MRSAGLGLFLARLLCAQTASVEGVTVNAITQEPIAGVHVRLVTGTFGGVTSTYGALSDRDGHFSIALIRPGTYILGPERSGYLYTGSRNGEATIPNVTIRAGQPVKDLRIEMSPRAVLAGKVLDEFGDPVQGAVIRTAAVSEKDRSPTIMGASPLVRTDDRGEFRIVTVPGRYYIQADGLNTTGFSSEAPEVRPDGSAVIPYRTTYYPSASVKERGTVVEAIGGRDVSGLEIRLSRQKTASISGVVSGIPERARIVVQVQWGSTPERTTGGTTLTPGPGGAFTAATTQPGHYRVWASSFDTSTGRLLLMSRVMRFQVDTADIGNLELTLAATGEFDGVLEFEGELPEAPRPKRTVHLQATAADQFNPGGGSVESDDKGVFKMSGVTLGKYAVKVDRLGDNEYVKRVALDGTVLPGDILDIPDGFRAGRLKVTIGRDGAQLTGRILDENGERSISTLGMAVLVPVPAPESLGGDSAAQVEGDGKFSFKHIRPGKYTLAGIDVFRQNMNLSLTEMVKNAGKGEEIEVGPGARLQKDARIQKKEVGDAKPKE